MRGLIDLGTRLAHGKMNRLTLLVMLLAARSLFLLCLPHGAHSSDVNNWIGVDAALDSGANPYNTTTFLNWPPLWMQVIFAAGRVARAGNFQLVNVLRCVLIAAEGGVLLLTHALLQRYCSRERSFWLALGAIALNPISILLTCQHCNFDIFVALFVLLALGFLLRFSENGDPVDWLCGCACLGLGALTKTVPLVLMPALAFGLRKLAWKVRMLGALLLLGPISLGISVIYSLGPKAVTDNVLHYRSIAGYFGVTGIFRIVQWPWASNAYTRLFPVVILALLALCALFAVRRARATSEELPLYFLGLLAVVPGLGPGYGPQYIYWFLALLPIVFVAGTNPRVRRAIIVFYAVAIVTYITEYAMFRSHGSFLVHLHPTADLDYLSGGMSSQLGQACIRMPLFLAWVFMLGAIFARAGQSLSRASDGSERAGVAVQ